MLYLFNQFLNWLFTFGGPHAEDTPTTPQSPPVYGPDGPRKPPEGYTLPGQR